MIRPVSLLCVLMCATMASSLFSQEEVQENVEKKEKRKPLLALGMGIFNMTGSHRNMLFQAEYKFSPFAYEFRPMVGITTTTKWETDIYAGLGFDIYLGKYIVLTPSFAPSLYFRGHGKDLGYPLEFRSSLELAAVVYKQQRIGVGVNHLSNAHLSSRNPGANSIVFYYAF
jgi:lipid A 3-O-deacylase